MGKYDHLSREELIDRLEEAELSETLKLQDRLDGERRIAQALVLMLQNYDSNCEEDIMRIVLERYDADRAFLFQFNWAEGTNSNIYEVYAEGITPELQNLQHLPNEALGEHLKQFQQGVPLVVNDIEQLPDSCCYGAKSIKKIFQLLQLKSAILFPMHIFGELWGYVGMETVRKYRYWTADDIEWLKAFTNVLSIGVSQRYIRTKADSNERKFSELFRNMPIGYIRHRIIYDASHQPVDYKFIEANPAFETLTGLKKEDCIGKTARQLSEHLNTELFHAYVDVATQGKLVQLDYPTRLMNKWFYSVLYSPRKDEFISLFYDITDRIRTTEKIKQNEKNLRTIFDNLPIGTINFDQDKKYLEANQEAFRIFGISIDGERGNDLTLLPEQEEKLKRDRQLAYDFIYDPVRQQVLSEKEDLPETALFVTTKIIMYTDDEEQCKGYLLIAVDNTKIHRTNRELTKTEKALTENLIRLSLILETGEIYPWYLDLGTGKLDISEDFYKAFGLDKSNHASYTMQDFIQYIHPDDLKTFHHNYENLKKGLCRHIKTELRIDINHQGYVWCEISAGTRSKGKDNEITKWLGFLTIIQKRKDNEAKLLEALKKAEESDKLKSAFLANVSHEIRTPLNAIVGFSELLANTDIEEDKRHYLEIVKTNNQLLLSLINDILDLSKIESGRIDLKESLVNIPELCMELCHVHQLKAKPGVKILFDEQHAPLRLYTDPVRLTQIYSNLINNAVKNTDRGSITLGYRRQGEKVVFFVRDTGKGIPKDKQDIIFNRFEKLNSNMQGFGLGLSICKSLLEKMEGSISLTSKEGEGTEFRFILPYRVPRQQNSKAATQEPEKAAKSPVALATPEGCTILIAEDIDCNYELLKIKLGGKYRLIRARTGIEAISLFGTEQPALILMDMKMPELDGLEATQIIRNVSSEIPIIALTAFAYDTDKENALNAGCNDFITKPIDIEELEKKIKQILHS